MNWRKINYILHRDIGFLCIGLTLLYVISGIAVNHISHDFNPSYKIVKEKAMVTPVSEGTAPDMTLINSILMQLDEKGAFKNAAMLSPGVIRIFTEGNTIDVNLATGEAAQEKYTRRPFLYELNYLHLNKPKKSWTIAADIYAVLLGFLAISGFFMIRKKTMKRGLILTAAGFAIPVTFLFLLL